MDTAKEERLTSAEISGLWSGYLFISSVHHVLKTFLTEVEDEEIKLLVELGLAKSKEHLENVTSIMQKEHFPIPRGITMEDINVNAPRLYTDKFYLYYMKFMAKFALMTFAISYTEASRQDIRQMQSAHMNDLQYIDQQVTKVLLSKNLFTPTPFIPIPKKVDFVKKMSYLAGLFAVKRPLTAMEINQLFLNSQSNALGKALLIGFIRVTQSKELKEYFVRGIDLSSRLYNTFSDPLKNENLSIPPTFDGEVMESDKPPFSDRLMLLHVNLLIPTGLGNYGLTLASSQRSDVAAMIGKVMLEVGTYAAEGAKLLIDRGWLEQPPLAPDLKSLHNPPHLQPK